MALRQIKITTRLTNRDSQSLERYLQEISKIPMISIEEEALLGRRIKSEDQQALDKLVQANLRFVVSVAKQYQHQGLSLSDLINEGNLGLIEAAQRFDETKGFKFISYAVWWIRQSIMQAIINQAKIVRIPHNKVSAYNKADKAWMAFEQEHERDPSIEELAELTDMDETEIATILQSKTHRVYLDAPIYEESDTTMADNLSDNGYDAHKDMMKDSLNKEINLVLDSLSPKEADIIKGFFGINNVTEEDIRVKYGIERYYMRTLKDKIMRRLKKSNRSGILQKYLG